MPLKFFNRIRFGTATEGDGTIAIGSAVGSAMLTPAQAGAVDGDQVLYWIDDGPESFEIGIGTIGNSGSTLTRDTVRQSKDNGVVSTAKLSLSGNAIVRIAPDAEFFNELLARLNALDAARGRSPVEVKDDDATALVADRGKTWVADGERTFTVDEAATLGDGWRLTILARGGDVTVDTSGSPAEEIDGEESITIPDGGEVTITCDGAAFHTNARMAPQILLPAPALIAGKPDLWAALTDLLVPMSAPPPTIERLSNSSIRLKAGRPFRCEFTNRIIPWPEDVDVTGISVGNNANRHVIVGLDSAGNAAVTHANTFVLPGGWLAARRAGSFMTDGSGNIRPFIQDGDRFYYSRIAAATISSGYPESFTDVSLPVPLGVLVEPFLAGRIQGNSNSAIDWFFAHGGQTSINNSVFTITQFSGTVSIFPIAARILTDTSGTINHRVNDASRITGDLIIFVDGWIDRRGRDL